jgi:hypothetical protein
MYDIITILIPIVLAICIVVIVRIVVDARVRRRLAETHSSEGLVLALLQADDVNRRKSSLKWGVVLLSLGVGCVLIDLLNLGVEDPSAFGVLFLAIGVGMVVHYRLDRETGRKVERSQP